jgi:hypothetical protein
MAPMTMDEFKCEEINFVVLSWLQENGFARLKRISEGKLPIRTWGGEFELKFFTIRGVFERELQIYVGNLT